MQYQPDYQPQRGFASYFLCMFISLQFLGQGLLHIGARENPLHPAMENGKESAFQLQLVAVCEISLHRRGSML